MDKPRQYWHLQESGEMSDPCQIFLPLHQMRTEAPLLQRVVSPPCGSDILSLQQDYCDNRSQGHKHFGVYCRLEMLFRLSETKAGSESGNANVY